MTYFILKYLFLFSSGCVLGWFIELIYRRYWGLAKRWINPGFLHGPYLPIYGFGIVALYILSSFKFHIILRICIFGITMTLFELIAGLILLKRFKMRLWDYRSNKFNYKGLICPLYTVFWTILSMFFYYIMYPYFYEQVYFLYKNLQFSLFIGMFYGIFLIDFITTMNVASTIKNRIDEFEEANFVLSLDSLRLQIRDEFKHISGKYNFKPNFFNTFRGIDLEKTLKIRIDDYRKNIKEYIKTDKK